jgi:hypothetical protein
MPARISVRAVNDAAPVWPSERHLRYDIVEPWGEERSFVCDGQVTLAVPPGAVEIRATRGLEWTDWRSVESIGPEGAHAVSITLEQPLHSAAPGWVAGDVHVHRDAGVAAELARAEGIQVVHCLSRYVDILPGGAAVSLGGPDVPSDRRTDRDIVIGAADVEIERIMGGPGAIIGLGPGPIAVGAVEGRAPFDDLLALSIREAGGLVDGEKIVWPSTPVLASLGLLDTVELACNHFGAEWTLFDLDAAGAIAPSGSVAGPRELVQLIFERYETLLGCGMRVAASGGSGAGVMPNPVGASRVYALVEGPLTMASWLAALRAGRTFSTNGPLLGLEVEGAIPGVPLAGPGPSVRSVTVRASSPREIETLELVVDGEVRGAWRPTLDEATAVSGELELDLSDSSWVCARAVEVPVGATAIRFAHTSPIWTGHPSSPARRRAAADSMLSWLGEAERWITHSVQRHGGLDGAQAAVALARGRVEQLASGGRAQP